MDHLAATPVDPAVLDAMVDTLRDHFGNASSGTHAFGWSANALADRAREEVAALVGCEPREVVFTSGATESNNLALRGSPDVRAQPGPHRLHPRALLGRPHPRRTRGARLAGRARALRAGRAGQRRRDRRLPDRGHAAGHDQRRPERARHSATLAADRRRVPGAGRRLSRRRRPGRRQGAARLPRRRHRTALGLSPQDVRPERGRGPDRAVRRSPGGPETAADRRRPGAWPARRDAERAGRGGDGRGLPPGAGAARAGRRAAARAGRPPVRAPGRPDRRPRPERRRPRAAAGLPEPDGPRGACR
ncbi:MAG: aminotransferase class V-fold PLP-dependent enzyme [bacterium]|nr:aminotransferase class V-fold PLP-dependent enzyme [bacterium]